MSEIRNDLRFLVMDVDGTMTDSGMYYSESGDEFKRFNAKDGIAMKRLSKRGFHLGMLSGGLGKKMAQRRGKMLGVRYVFVGPENKVSILNRWRIELKLEWNQIAYIGDDINDAEVIKMVGLSACPSDANHQIRAIADFILETKGGDGCIREFIDRFIGI